MRFISRPQPLRPWHAPLVVALTACGSAFTSAGADGGLEDSGSTPDTSVDTGPGKDGASDAMTTEAGKVPETGAGEASTGDAGPSSPTYCGPSCTCSTGGTDMCASTGPGPGDVRGNVCCVADETVPATYSCAATGCAGCDTQLECTRQADCGGNHCCIASQKSSICSTGHYVAQCQKTCGIVSSELCDIGNPMSCGMLAKCSPSTAKIGLPSNSGFGVCTKL
jgi:hypothetical protein